MKSTNWVCLGSAALFLSFGLSSFARQPLTFDERVKAQEAIERVYYEHRIWPKENPGPKPPFEEMVPRAQIEAKVTDYLKKSAALDQFWQRPIEPAQLQAEMERMATGTKAPETLRRLFEALGNDPELIAETLVRESLAARLVHNYYVFDGRIHAVEREKAEGIRTLFAGGVEWEAFQNEEGVEYGRVLWRVKEEGDLGGEQKSGGSMPQSIEVEAETLARRYGELKDAGFEGIFRETEEGYVMERLVRGDSSLPVRLLTASELAQAGTQTGLGSIEVESLFIRKKPFDVWFLKMEEEKGLSHNISLSFSFILPPILGAAFACTPDTWMATTTAGAPSGRRSHTAVWTGSEMIVWGGNNGSYLNTGGRYNPSTDSWTATTTTGAPTAREYPTAVWGGSEMIVWGGYWWSGTNHYENTGGRYDPATNSWIATTTTGAPSAREFHTAVWAGSEMIVWGGYPTTNTGGRYHPATDDSWTATATSGAPSGRYSHTAVWMGSGMIVWGGSGGSSQVNTGGRGNPAIDSWTATTTTGAPSGRRWHTAVWSGSKMIIWGGYDSGAYFNTGGRYNPATTDSWIATTTAGAPSARRNHTAVWTGSEMIVWGGNGFTPTYKNDGGRYDPVVDSWTATTTTGAPSARSGHTAVWTGSKMIVWGGDNGSYLSTGGIYTPTCPPPASPSAVPDGNTVPGVPLTMAKGAGTSVDLAWGVACNTTDYAVMVGDFSTLSDGYNHTAELCSTAGATTANVNPAGNTLYFLIVPHDGANEGSYGKNSAAVERSTSASPCYPQSIGSCL